MGAAVKKNMLKYPIIFLFWSTLVGCSDRFNTAWDLKGNSLGMQNGGCRKIISALRRAVGSVIWINNRPKTG
jgi:hypothetical protein